MERWHGLLTKKSDYLFEIPMSYKQGMRVPGLVFADEALLELALQDQALEQVVNVAFLPGIINASMAMPDIHWGYGFPIGGVAAVDIDSGVVSPGGVGFDISCGVRLMRTDLEAGKEAGKLAGLLDALTALIPKGVGSTGPIKLSKTTIREVFVGGAKWAIKSGYGLEQDLRHIEHNGTHSGANPDKVSEHALHRGLDQSGTLGAGNHFIEVQEVSEIYDQETATAFGLLQGQIVIMVHSGSRGVGHQICTDYVKVMGAAVRKYGYDLPDRQLACAPLDSPEGRDYLGAMTCAANYALANRQCLGHWVRLACEKTFGAGSIKLGLDLVFDVSHNLATIEEHEIEGIRRRVCVHRKGATRAFGPGHESLPAEYKKVGQPVIIPGDMGRASYVLAGTDIAMQTTFGSTCHGAGRLMSRAQAKKQISGTELRARLERQGVIVKAGKMALLAEEAPDAYKDVSRVVDVCEGAGISKKVARLKPLGVLKG